MFRVRRIVAKNFLSYPSCDLDFGDDKNFILIEAEPSDGEELRSNGFGKSTLAEMIGFGIYGGLMRTLSTRPPAQDIIRRGAKRAEVEIHLDEVGDKASNKPLAKVVIKRTVDIDGSRTLNMWENGKPRKFDKKGDASKVITEWLGIDFDMFMSRFLTPESTSFIAKKPTERFRVVSSIQTFDWDRVYLDALKRSNVLKNELEQYKRELSDLKIQEVQAEGLHEMVTYKHQSLRGKIEQLTARIDDLKVQIAEQEKKLAELVKELDALEPQVSAAAEEHNKTQRVIVKLQERIRTLKAEKPDVAIRKRFESIGSIKCMYCGRELDTESLIQQLAELRKAEVATLLEDFVNAEALTQTSAKESGAKYTAVKNKYDALAKERDKVNAQLRVFESEVSIISKERGALEAEVEEASQQMSVADSEQRLKNIKTKISEIESTIEHTKQQYFAYLIVRNASQASSPARLNSVFRLLPALAQGVTNVATHLFGRPIRVNFSINDKQLEIESPDLYLSTMSTGERKSFDIAWACTVQDILLQSSRNQIGFFVGDELFDGLDTERISAAINLLKALPIPQIFIITHNESARSAIALAPEVSIIRVTNKNGQSRATFVGATETSTKAKVAQISDSGRELKK
jgi:DNA repair exonuclease SbcCD ATPase subunit